VVFVLRTRKTPFFKSKPGKYLVLSSLMVVAVAFILPYTLLGSKFGFLPPSGAFYPALAGLIAAYLLLTEVVKKWFVKKYSYLLEQTVPKKSAPSQTK
jgi:Mg2+-importing ATPase